MLQASTLQKLVKKSTKELPPVTLVRETQPNIEIEIPQEDDEKAKPVPHSVHIPKRTAIATGINMSSVGLEEDDKQSLDGEATSPISQKLKSTLDEKMQNVNQFTLGFDGSRTPAKTNQLDTQTPDAKTLSNLPDSLMKTENIITLGPEGLKNRDLDQVISQGTTSLKNNSPVFIQRDKTVELLREPMIEIKEPDTIPADFGGNEKVGAGIENKVDKELSTETG